ncbi:Tn3 family transposase [Pararhizobium sp. LjRoot238]
MEGIGHRLPSKSPPRFQASHYAIHLAHDANAIVHWNTVYLSRATEHLRQRGRNIADELLEHVSPHSGEHVNLTGIHSWDAEQQMPEGFRALRLPGRRLKGA